MNGVHTSTIRLGDQEIVLETGNLAPQAKGAVVARQGETVVFAAVTASQNRSDKGFFPLSVEYMERLYAGGRISSSRFIKREGRPPEQSVLNGRLIDRSLRPLFPKGFANEVQVAITVLAIDGEHDAAMLGLIASAAALHISDIPWNGPLAGVRMGYVNDTVIMNPTDTEMKDSRLDLVVSGTAENIVMVESAAKEVPEEVILEAFDKAGAVLAEICKGIDDLRKQAGKEKFEFTVPLVTEEVRKAIEEFVKPKVQGILDAIAAKKMNKEDAMSDIKKEVAANFKDQEGYTGEAISDVVDALFKYGVRGKTIKDKVRVDGRGIDDVRELTIEASVLPRVHGSAIFKRGMTQTLTTVTLGSPALEQLMESAEGEETKRYMHHYNFPPYSVGEVGRYGSPGRREIGHGNLAERALMAVIPGEDVFPYAIRVVNEIMSSNGSSSMASVCGSTLALMDAGVPITKPVSGVAMGLMKDEATGTYVVLTDIAGIEDATGDMDFKVAGTTEGITALQMDIKISGVSKEIMKDALAAARRARLFILDAMLAVLPAPRAQISQYAPKVVRITIDPEMIGLVIGSGGKTVNQIIKECGVTVDIEDDGTIMIAGVSQEGVDKAKAMIEAITHEVKVGDVYEGVVRRIMPFGAFVELVPGKDGMVHISKLAPYRVAKVEDVLNIGDTVTVKVIEIDAEKRVNLTLDVNEEWPKIDRAIEEGDRREREGGRDRNDRGRGGDRRGGRGRW